MSVSQWPEHAPRGAVAAFCAEHQISRKTFPSGAFARCRRRACRGARAEVTSPAKERVGKLGSGATLDAQTLPRPVVRPESQAARIVRLESELSAAQAEARKLAEERDILRQAAKYFAGETNW